MGRGRNVITGRLIKATSRPDGYQVFNLKMRPRRQAVLVHRVLLTVFNSPPPYPGAQARHMDGHPSNNALTNLRWGTPKENAADKLRHGTTPKGERNPCSKLTAGQVVEMRALRGRVHANEVAERFGVHRTNVYMIWRRETWGHLDA